jgi:hypothetical protein
MPFYLGPQEHEEDISISAAVFVSIMLGIWTGGIILASYPIWRPFLP